MKKTVWLAIMALFLLMGCGNNGKSEESTQADELIEKAQKSKNYQEIMAVADSMEAMGVFSPAKANYWRGYASDRMGKKRMAEFYWSTSVKNAANSEKAADLDIYAKSASRLANLLSMRGDFASTLKMAIPVIERLEALQCDTTSDYVNLLVYVGCCEVGDNTLGSDAIRNFNRATEKHFANVAKKHDDGAYKDAIAGFINIAYACNAGQDYKEALNRIDNFGKLLGEYEQRLGTDTNYTDKQLARFDIFKAVAYEGLGQKEEAAKVYQHFLETHYSKTPEGRISANSYLTAADRWDLAADNYKSLNALLNETSKPITMDDIQTLMLKKYQANLKAGRRDSAVAISMLICDSLDHALALAKKIDEEEQVTIVQKVEQMEEQAAAAQRLDYWIAMGALAVLFLLFIGYFIYRHYRGHLLRKAHHELKEAYVQLEENTATKERTDTEQRISHNMRQYLLSQALPKVKGLSLHAQLIPGTALPCDFYEAIVRDEKLFFCIGSSTEQSYVSGVIAGTVTALFRTAATLDDKPERIVGAINSSVQNQVSQGMQRSGVIIFVGVLDLSTGHLTYCNAGHQPPVLLDTEVTPLPVEESKPIGIDPNWNFTAQETDLPKGATLFLYTAGLANAENADHKPFSDKRVLGTALQGMKLELAPKPFIDSMCEAVEKHTASRPSESDMTLFAISR